MTTRAEQKEKRQEEILIGALELFIRKGYSSTKTSEISKSLNISEGLLFHYFKSKEGLLEALVDIAIKENHTWLDHDSVDPLMYFEQAANGIINCLKEDEAGSKFFILVAQIKQGEGIPKHIYEKVKSPENKMLVQAIRIIERGQAMGTIRQGDPMALLYLFSDSLQGIAMQHNQHPEIPLPNVEWIIDMLKNHH